MQGVERDELLQRVGQQAQPRQHALGLLVLTVHARRQKAAQVVFVALRFGKAGAAVEGRVAQQIKARRHCLFPAGVGLFVHWQHLLS